MLIIPGTLVVKEKKGWLECAIGHFHVQYADMASLHDGRHEGFFEIAQIVQRCHNDQGKYCFEVEAVINKMAFPPLNNTFTVNLSEQQEHVVEDHSDIQLTCGNQGTLLETDTHGDEELFGTLWPLQDQVQLDVTQHRNRLRSQCLRLKRLGYQLNYKEQIWHKAVVQIA